MLNILKLIVLFQCMCFVLCQNLQEGSECTLDGFKGRCVELKRCFYVIQLFYKNKKPQICSFKGDTPIVCCTDCDLVDDIDNIVVNPQRGVYHKDGRGKSWDYCIDSLKSLPYDCKNHYFFTLVKEWNETRQCHDVRFTAVGASGGVDAKRGELPHMALLGYGEEGGMQWLCGGTIISRRFILTAGHCIASSNLGPVTMVAVSILKRSDPDNIWQKHSIEDIIPHPDYKSPSKYNDIALLKTASRIRYSDVVLPACLPNPKTLDLGYAVAAGWGALGARREVADTLQKVILFPLTETQCSSLYEANRLLRQGFNSNTQSCWGNNGIQDTCSGDSGGPLHVDSGCVYDVIGVTSYGRDCGRPGQAGMYTRVAHYVSWIESVVWP